MGMLSGLKRFYEAKWKTLLIITLLLIPIALGILLVSKVTTGEFFQKGVSLKGGETYTFPVDRDYDLEQLRSSLISSTGTDISVRGVSEFGRLTAIIVEASDIDEDSLISSIKSEGIKVVEGTYSKESIGSSLGQSFFRQLIIAVIIAFVFMAIVVFLTFRKLLPTGFIILAVASTIIEALAVVSILGIRVSTAGVAAFLMLIGYAVDSNILLTSRAIKRKEGALTDRINSALRTGLTMTLTAFVTVTVAYFFSDSDVIKQIMLILALGLIFDLINTWVQNVAIIRWDAHRRQKKLEAEHGQS